MSRGLLSLVPPAAGLDPALQDLGFRLTSIFAFRPPEVPEATGRAARLRHPPRYAGR